MTAPPPDPGADTPGAPGPPPPDPAIPGSPAAAGIPPRAFVPRTDDATAGVVPPGVVPAGEPTPPDGPAVDRPSREGRAGGRPAAAGATGGGAGPVDPLAPRVRARHLGLAIAAMALGGFTIGVTESGTMGLLPQIAEGVGATIPQAGRLISAYALGVVVGAPLLAIVGSRWPRKGFLVGLACLQAALHLATVLVASYPVLLGLRFLAGFPHGALMGTAALIAADLVPRPQRAWAVAMLLLGIPVASIAGVPVAVALGQAFGWRMLYVVVGLLALSCAIGSAILVPRIPPEPDAPSLLGQLGVLARPQVLLALAIPTVGFGGAFATMSYIAPTLMEVTGLAAATVPLVMACYGIGAAAGSFVAASLARAGVARALVLAFAFIVTVLLLFGFAVQWAPTAVLAVAALGTASSTIVPLLQTRLMEVAHGGQALAASLNHATLNIGNATGALVGGAVLATGLGYTWPSRAGAVLAALGLAVAVVAFVLDRRRPAGE